MKTLKEEQTVQVIELNENELSQVNGGIWWVAFGAAIFAYDAICDFRDGWNSVQ